MPHFHSLCTRGSPLIHNITYRLASLVLIVTWWELVFILVPHNLVNQFNVIDIAIIFGAIDPVEQSLCFFEEQYP